MNNSNFHHEIALESLKIVKTFFDDWKNGTTVFKSLNNLTEQMTHDYSNRFLVELIQNAYDAIGADEDIEPDDGRMKIVFNEADENGVLYFANTGHAFSSSNFHALARLGQSDKDPMTSVGNKGIGFRSVLQICNCPQIFSGVQDDHKGYQGYCFEFNPRKKDMLATAISELLINGNHQDLLNLFNIDEINLLWSQEEINQLKIVLQQKSRQAMMLEDQFLKEELKGLSTYLLTMPLISKEMNDPILLDMAAEGYSTVIKLKLTENNAAQKVREAIQKVNSAAFIFLDRVKIVTLDHLGHIDRNLSMTILKEFIPLKNDLDFAIGQEIISVSGKEEKQRWYVFTSTIGGSNQPEYKKKIEDSTEELPSNWQGTDCAKISIAVPVGEKAINGLIYIFLPTEKKNGLAYHINAPFYGEINRKNIDVSKTYNKLLLTEASEIAVKAAEYLKREVPQNSENILMDLLCYKNEDDDLIQLEIDSLKSALFKRSMDLSEWEIIPYKNNEGQTQFSNIKNVCLLPMKWDYSAFSVINLVKFAEAKILSGVSSDRLESVDRVTKNLGFDMAANSEKVACWAELLAKHFCEEQVKIDWWNQFYMELSNVIKSPGYLVGKKVLLGDDFKLHSGGKEDKDNWIFLNPVQTASEERDDEISLEIDLPGMTIPDFLTQRIAFLNSRIELYQQDSKNRKNKNQFLDYITQGSNQLVERFRVQSILDKVILPVMNSAIVSHVSPLESQLWETFRFIMALHDNSRRELNSMQEKFSRILVPCRNGWYPANETYFSEDWDGVGSIQFGKELTSFFSDPGAGDYLEGTGKQVVAMSEMLKHISGISKEKTAQFFCFCGVSDYLKLVPIGQNGKLSISGSNRKFEFPESFNDSKISQKQCEYYKQYVNKLSHYFAGQFSFEIDGMKTIDGFWRYENLSKEGRYIFSKLVCRSIVFWTEWDKGSIRKPTGESFYCECYPVVRQLLSEIPWVPCGIKDSIEYKTPKESWYVSTEFLRRQIHTYAMLPFIEPEVAKIIENQNTIDELSKLKVSCFDVRTIEEGFSLLRLLANSFEEGKVKAELINAFKGHYRDVWNTIYDYFPNHQDNKIINPPDLLMATSAKNELISWRIKENNFKENHFLFVPDDKKLTIQLQNNPIIYLLLIEPGKKFMPLLNKIADGSLVPISDLKQDIIADGNVIGKDRSDQLPIRLFDEEEKWMLPVLLSVVVYREDSGISLSALRFKEIVALLRRAKVINCKKIERQLKFKLGDQQALIERIPVDICVSKDTETFFMNNDNVLELQLLAPAVSEYLEISALEVPLKLVLLKLNINLNDRDNSPDEDSILDALKEIRITEENYNNVKRAMNESLEWTLERIYPAVLALEKSGNIKAEEIKNHIFGFQYEAELVAFLTELRFEDISPEQLVEFARDASSDKEMGMILYKKLRIDLKQWNAAIVKSGTNQPILNTKIGEDFSRMKNQYVGLVFGIVRFMAVSENQPDQFVKNIEAFNDWLMPETWIELYWEIAPALFISELKSWLVTLPASEPIVQAFDQVENVDQLSVSLKELIPDIDLAGEDIAKENRQLFINEIVLIREILFAYINKYSADENQPSNPLLEFSITEDKLLERILKNISKEYLEIEKWNDERIFRAIMESEIIMDFQKVIQGNWLESKNCKELMEKLNIAQEELVDAESEFRKKREQIKIQNTIQKRLISIKGFEFDSDESNLPNLLVIVNDKLVNEMKGVGAIDNTIELKSVKPRTAMGGGNPKPNEPSERGKRIGKEKEVAIGLAGEYLVYQMLKKTFGQQVTPDSWKSNNRKYMYPDNPGNDSLGYDFEICLEKKKYYIEVKSTIGGNYQFDMGSSETTKALELTKNKKIEYIIAFITYTLDHPTVYWLPNPFSDKGKKLFSINDVGARVRFTPDNE